MSVINYTLRDEQPNDLKQLAELLVTVDAAWGKTPFRYTVREGGLPAAKDIIQRPKTDSIIAEHNNEIVGYCALREVDGTLVAVNSLVHPNLQSHGIGTAMLGELCTRANTRDEHIHAEVLLDSQASYHMCLKLGFQEYGRFTGKISGREGRLLCRAPENTDPCYTKPQTEQQN